MKRKHSAIITLCMAAGIILSMTAVDLITKDRIFSQAENRILAKRPSFSVQALFNGSFTEDYEEYVTDQFAGRDTWISVKTASDIVLGKKEVGGVYLAKDDYLIEQHLPEDISEKTVDKRLTLLADLVKNYEQKAGQIKVMLVPTADNILTDKLPRYAAVYDQNLFLQKAAGMVGENYFVDTMAVMQAHKEEAIYYRTDHHWTTLGAYYGYAVWAESMGMIPVSYNESTQQTVTEEFLGTLHSKINLPTKPDSIQAYHPQETKEYKVYYDFAEEYRNSLYEQKYLSLKNKYGYFLDDNHPFIKIETDMQNGKTLFVIKDSYANCFVPFAAEHYETICIVDLRYYNMKLYELMDTYMQEDNTDILVLYDIVHFIDDFQYY